MLIPPPAKLVGYVPGAHIWIEYKQPGGDLTPAQKRRIPKMRERGEVVVVVDVVGYGVSLAAQWQKALFAHHDPFATTDKIAAAEAQARAYYESRLVELKGLGEKFQPVDWSFAIEGMEFGI